MILCCYARYHGSARDPRGVGRSCESEHETWEAFLEHLRVKHDPCFIVKYKRDGAEHYLFRHLGNMTTEDR